MGYDFGARMYNPQIGRWMAVDPKANWYASMSPYTGIGNDPVNYFDPNGESLLGILYGAVVIGGSAITLYDAIRDKLNEPPRNAPGSSPRSNVSSGTGTRARPDAPSEECIDVGGIYIEYNQNYGGGRPRKSYLRYENGFLFDRNNQVVDPGNISDEFVKTTSDFLQQMNGTDQGEKLLNELSNSDNRYTIKNEYPADKNGNPMKNAAQFNGANGDLLLGYLMSPYNNNLKIMNLAHELFHAYQNHMGESGRSVEHEVEAELFGVGMAYSLTEGTFRYNFGTLFENEGIAYNTVMWELIKNKYNQDTFNKKFREAVDLFKVGNVGNKWCNYDTYDIIGNDYVPLIKDFIPFNY